MEEKINQSPKNKINRRFTPKEGRLKHLKQWQESGLSVSEYCRQQGIPSTSFNGWRRTLMQPKQIFKPVIAVPDTTSATKSNQGAVIEIMAEPSIRIRVLNVTDTSLVVKLARELNKCSQVFRHPQY